MTSLPKSVGRCWSLQGRLISQDGMIDTFLRADRDHHHPEIRYRCWRADFRVVRLRYKREACADRARGMPIACVGSQPRDPTRVVDVQTPRPNGTQQLERMVTLLSIRASDAIEKEGGRRQPADCRKASEGKQRRNLKGGWIRSVQPESRPHVLNVLSRLAFALELGRRKSQTQQYACLRMALDGSAIVEHESL